MNNRYRPLVAATLAALSWQCTPEGDSQSSEGAAAPIADASAAGWTARRTPDGQPDLQGIWVNFDSTPFEPDPGAARAHRRESARSLGRPQQPDARRSAGRW